MWKEVKQGLLETIWATGQTLTSAQPTHKYLHTHFTTIRDTQHSTSSLHSSVHPPSWPVCSTNTHWSHTSLYECAKEHTHTHMNTHTQLEPAPCALKTELVGIELSLFLCPLMVCRPQKEKGRQSQSQCTKDWTASERVLGTKIQISPSSSQLELAFLPGACREGRLWHWKEKKTGETTSKRKKMLDPHIPIETHHTAVNVSSVWQSSCLMW